MAISKILVQGIKLHAYHGCMHEESIIGGKYVIDVCIDANLDKPSTSDKLDETIDYVAVFEIVKKEMAIRSKLIEHVAKRILSTLENSFPTSVKIEVKVSKLNPPIPGNVEQVSVVLTNK